MMAFGPLNTNERDIIKSIGQFSFWPQHMAAEWSTRESHSKQIVHFPIAYQMSEIQ